MEENSIGSKGARILIVCGMLVLAASSAFWMLSTRTLDSHECFVSVTAREMLQSGDLVARLSSLVSHRGSGIGFLLYPEPQPLTAGLMSFHEALRGYVICEKSCKGQPLGTTAGNSSIETVILHKEACRTPKDIRIMETRQLLGKSRLIYLT